MTHLAVPEPRLQHRLEQGDLSLFAAIESQTSENDRTSLLACQHAVGLLLASYAARAHLRVAPSCKPLPPLPPPHESGVSARVREACACTPA